MTEHKVALTFEGADRIDIACRVDEDIITAALRQGYLLLSDCREGSCSTCRGFLVDGDYDQLLSHSPHALTDAEEEEGLILACRLRPPPRPISRSTSTTPSIGSVATRTGRGMVRSWRLTASLPALLESWSVPMRLRIRSNGIRGSMSKSQFPLWELPALTRWPTLRTAAVKSSF